MADLWITAFDLEKRTITLGSKPPAVSGYVGCVFDVNISEIYERHGLRAGPTVNVPIPESWKDPDASH